MKVLKTQKGDYVMIDSISGVAIFGLKLCVVVEDTIHIVKECKSEDECEKERDKLLKRIGAEII